MVPSPDPKSLERSIIEDLIYGPPDAVRRYTQDSPILPDVWMQYGARLDEPQELLVTPFFGATAGDLAQHLRRELVRHRESLVPSRIDANIAYNRTYVAARLYFDELICLVLPMTGWWVDEFHEQRMSPREPASPSLTKLKSNARIRAGFVSMLEALEAEERGDGYARDDRSSGSRVSIELLWMVRLAGTLAWAQHEAGRSRGSVRVSVRPTPAQIVAAAADLFAGIREPQPPAKHAWLVNLNREARTAMRQSVLAVKADAARFLFKVRCSDLVWGVIDNGVDARHPALWNWSAEQVSKRPSSEKARDWERHWTDHTRVAATYDFTRIRHLLDPSKLDEPKTLPAPVRAMLHRKGGAQLRDQLQELKDRLLRGRGIDWALVAPFLQVAHDEHYIPPSAEHGTHVAGILGAEWPEEDILGVCPDINLYDFRVMGPGGANDEFAVLAALQFVDHLNDQKDFFAVHGVNISLAIRHEVANFACGRTPVCDECERLVASGVVVVAAAGNEGYMQYKTARGEKGGYQTVSITDPGNAEKVVTVGATHRFQPHTYGVSYFSSRGPTGDGRLKPDLVAPGEKILAPVPDADFRHMDGTSMAAPHVSGAAAMLMARHSELIGQPERIKDTLCRTATDLNRERYFQGAGMLDVLRALQSV